MPGAEDKPGSRARNGRQGSVVGVGPRQEADEEAAQGRNAGDRNQEVAMGLRRFIGLLGSRTCRSWIQ